ncbi:UNVERIFIED_CONTAM: DNA damage-binding protein 1 [Sesamum radiatum]|uniref:DNA damage-binding protein 1 n=1 Tax=Sesamum radiatum TaxID=300843 RepID=A0AAW2KHN6_SESRA
MEGNFSYNELPPRIWCYFVFLSHYLPMLDVPIYGRIATLELFRPHGESQDLLFIATERYKFCVLQWDAETAEVITRAMGDVSDRIGRPTDNGQIGIIDPDCRLIGLHLYDGLFKVIPFDNKGQLKEAFNIRLEELQVLDIKFLYGCPKPTIVVLYQDNKDARHVKTYEVALKDKDFIEGPWSQNNLDNGAELLIPVPPPLCGVLIIGEETIVYCSASAFKAIPIRPSITRAYGRVDADGSRYLLGDHNGLLHLLVITHEKEKVTGLKIELLGETSVASSISYLDNAVVFVGSSYGDSQVLIGSLERYVNLGPIVDFCVVDLERQGQGQVVTCSGAYKDGSLRIVRNGIGINEQASVELQGIKGMWLLRSATDDPYDTFLVVSFISETRILAMNLEDELEETEIEGFCSNIQTLFCHDAMYDQLVQIQILSSKWKYTDGLEIKVTSNGVRLVSSTTRELCNEWFSPAGYSINVATANATQVLLATGGGHLVYLEIGDGVLTEVKHAQLEYDISCLDINPIGDNPNYSQLAAVGMWTDISVRIYSLPDLNLITKEHLGGEIIPRSVLLCSFEGISYLLCALGDGHLLNFLLNTSNGELADRKKVSLGTQPITLRTFSSKNATHVFAASDRPTVIYSSNKKLLYSNVNLKEVSHMCPFNSAAFPDSCSFSDDNNVYYCVGTAYVMPEENEPTKGRILVFAVEDGKLQLIAEKETKGAVYSLNAFNGKLLAAINQKIQLYKWMLREDGSRELQSNVAIMVTYLRFMYKLEEISLSSGDLMKSISLLIYKHEEGAIEERARDYNANWMSAVEILDDDIYLGAEIILICSLSVKIVKGQLMKSGDALRSLVNITLVSLLIDSDMVRLSCGCPILMLVRFPLSYLAQSMVSLGSLLLSLMSNMSSWRSCRRI